jgi:hypothetical protein
MQRVLLLSAFLALVAMAVALPTSGAPSGEFKAQFQDDDCATHTNVERAWSRATDMYPRRWTSLAATSIRIADA